MATKRFCDHCGKETDEAEKLTVRVIRRWWVLPIWKSVMTDYELCRSCNNAFHERIIKFLQEEAS